MPLKQLATNIEVESARKKMTQYKLSELSGVSATQLSLITNNKVNDVKYSTLNKIAMALDVKAWELLKGDE